MQSGMEQPTGVSGHEHVIDIPRDTGPSVSASHSVGRDNHEGLNPVDRPSTRAAASALQPPSAIGPPHAGNASGTRRSDNYGRRHRSPLNSGLWISIEVIVNVSQIVAAIVVLSLSRKEHPQAPLFEWVIGYTVGCFATLPHLYWRYIHRNIVNGQDEQAHSLQGSSQNNSTEPTPASVSERRRTAARNAVLANPRINALFDHFKMALDCFFAVWFVVGNVWIFGGRSSAVDAPNLYRLCIVFLTFSCIGYAMPFILCAMICCCLPCIISVMGFREDTNNTRGATSESINTLPTYKFKTKKRRHGSGNEAEGQDGGVVAAGTDKERALSAEDAVCCICLAKYAHNDELRELPCTHCFHKECVDKWLKINALCPLCKAEIASSSGTSDTRHTDHSIPVQEIEMH